MTVCDSSTFALSSGALVYFGSNDAHWRVPVELVRVIGEFRATDEDEGHFLAVITDDSGAWLRAPACAAGLDDAIEQLGRTLNCDLRLRLSTAAAPSSRVLWPTRVAGQSLFATFEVENERTKHRACSLTWPLHPKVLELLRHSAMAEPR